MPTNYSHPGIYIQEVAGAHTIQGAPTSVAAFVGATELGPTNVPTLITSWNAYQRVFGGLIWGPFLPWAVYEFFREGGGQCWVVRATDSSGKVAGASTLHIAAASPGTWANRLGIAITNSDPTDTKTAPIFTVSVVFKPSGVTLDTKKLHDGVLDRYLHQNTLETLSLGSGGTHTEYVVLESFSGLSGTNLAAAAARINANSMFIRVDPATFTSRPSNSSAASALSSGADSTLNFTTAVNTLSGIQGISLIAMPDLPAVTDLKNQGAAINQLLSTCEQHANLFYVVDSPFGLEVQGRRVLQIRSGYEYDRA